MVSKINNALVAAIDIGATYSGYAYSFRHDYNKDPTKIYIPEWFNYLGNTSHKQPTCVLCGPNGKFHSFGYIAERKYDELAVSNLHHEWYFFRRFPMHMNGKQLETGMIIEDDKSLKMPAIKVFGMAMNYLKNELLGSLRQRKFLQTKVDDIHWVLTVPAVWTDSAQQFMRDAANEAGINGSQLTIVLEPNAAAMYLKMLSSNHLYGMENFDDTKYIVMYIKDETADISVYEKQDDDTTKEVYKVCCGPWGYTNIDEEFTKMIIHILGAPTFSEFCEENKSEYQEMLSNLKQRIFDVTTDTHSVYVSLTNVPEKIYRRKYGKSISEAIKQSQFSGKITYLGSGISIAPDLFQGLLQNSISTITEHLKDFLAKPCVTGTSTLLMVGEFAECKFLQEAVRKTFPNVLIPNEAVLVVVKGAVLLGNTLGRASKEDENAVSSDDMASQSSTSTNKEQSDRHDGGMNLISKRLSEESAKVASNGCVERKLEVQDQDTSALEVKLENQMKLTADVERPPSDDELFTLSRKLDKCQKEWWLLAKLLGLSDDSIDEMERSGGHIVRQYYKMLTAWKRQNTELEKCSIKYLLKICNEAGIDRQLTMDAFKK